MALTVGQGMKHDSQLRNPSGPSPSQKWLALILDGSDTPERPGEQIHSGLEEGVVRRNQIGYSAQVMQVEAGCLLSLVCIRRLHLQRLATASDVPVYTGLWLRRLGGGVLGFPEARLPSLV